MVVELDELKQQIGGHSFWLTYLSGASNPVSLVGIHVAVFAEPFLSLVFSGRKTIEFAL